MKLNEKVISLLMTFALVISFTITSFAQTEQLPEFTNGEEVIDEIVQGIIEDGDFEESQESEIFEDIEILDSLGLDINNIENVDVVNADIVYSLEINEGITNEIFIEQEAETIIMDVIEGEKHDTLVLEEDGTMYLDGKQVIVETEEFFDMEEATTVTFSETGGTKWYKQSEAPSKLKKASYKSFPKNPSYRNGNVNLNKALRNIAYATIIAIMLEALTGGTWKVIAAGGVKSFTGAALIELCTYNPNSKNISFKDYIARGKSNSRYLKCKRNTWAKKNYSGKYTTTYSYGLVQ